MEVECPGEPGDDAEDVRLDLVAGEPGRTTGRRAGAILSGTPRRPPRDQPAAAARPSGMRQDPTRGGPRRGRRRRSTGLRRPQLTGFGFLDARRLTLTPRRPLPRR